LRNQCRPGLADVLTGPDVGLLFDTGHITFAGGDAYVELLKHVDRVVHVHCKDVRRAVMQQAKAENWSFLDAVLKGVFTVPGDGMIDFAPILATLQRHGYRGWLVVEPNRTRRWHPAMNTPRRATTIWRPCVPACASRLLPENPCCQ
jgi:sugar phosphate isomerase/epimerase